MDLVKSVGRRDVSPPRRTVSVLTTLSFAAKPVIRDVDILQSANPSGLNIGATALPNMASRLSSDFAHTFKRVSKVCKNQIMTDAKKIMVNAFVIKSFAFSPINFNTFTAPRHTVVRKFHYKRHRVAFKGSVL